MKNYKKIFLIGLGFFTVTLAWAVYNAFVPIYLDRLLDNTVLIGFIMTFDNISGVIFQPYFGSLSDKTNTRYGRRMPYLMIGIPLAAIALSLIPFHTGIYTLMGTIIIMNFGMSIYRAPVVALMPDCTPEKDRSKANGIINLMGGLGTLIAFLLGGILFDRSEVLPFMLCSGIMIISIIILSLIYKEPAVDISAIEREVKKEKTNIRENVKGIKELLLILVAVFFLFCGYNAIETYLSLYSGYVLNISPGEASFIFALLAGSFLIFSVPAGYIGEKLGRLKTMIIGLTVITISLAIIVIYPEINVVKTLMIISGISWALVMINSYPYVVSLAPENKTGKYTGFYYFFSFFASIVSPLLFGVIVDLVKDYKVLFVYSAAMFDIALIILLIMYFKTKIKERKNI